jgi:RNA polymerase sigma-70 factor (ECF subfamily)
LQDDDTSKRTLVEQSCIRWERELKAFLLGVMRVGDQVEDAYQRTCVRAIQSCESVVPATVRGWLFRIALNEARQMRRRDRRVGTVVEDLSTLPDAAGGARGLVELGLVSEEFTSHLAAAISALPEGQREVLTMRLVAGLSFAEIASQLERPVGTVLTWMHRGIQRLREHPLLKTHWSDLTGE